MTATEPTIRLLPDVYPDCRCSHDRDEHRRARECGHVPCGCLAYRPKLVAV